MTSSVGVQADMNDPEGVIGIVRSFRDQLREIQGLNTTLLELRRDRDTMMDRSQSLSEMLEGKITTLISGAEAMEGQLQQERENNDAADTELEQLLKEKESLDSELHQLHGQEVTITNTDIDNEQRLLGFVEEEVSTKMEALSQLQARLRDVQAEYMAEWEGYKSDIDQHDGSTGPYRGLAEHVDELRLARYIGSLTAKEAHDVSARDLCERLVRHHWNKITYQQLNRKLVESQIRERDYENEIGALFTQKTEMWKRCLDLEHCLDDLKDTSDEVNMLRPSPAYADLPDVSEGRLPRDAESDIDIADEALHDHGTMLHRCHKNINIAIDMSDEELEPRSVENETTVDIDDIKVDPESADVTDTPPATSRDQPEMTQEPTTTDSKGSGARDIDANMEPETIQQTPEVEQQETEDQTTEAPAQQVFDEETPNTSFMSKLRRRVAGGSSSSQRIKGVPKLTATGSTKRFNAMSFSRRRR